MKNTGIRGHRPYLILILLFVPASMILAAGQLSAAPVTSIPGLFNTGVNDNGEVLPDGSKDPHYQLILPGSGIKDAFKIPIDKLPPPGTWAIAPMGSAWIGPNAGNASGPAGDYSYVLTFDLTGFNSSKVEILGSWASDNSSRIYLNGKYTDNSRNRLGFRDLISFDIKTGFLSGINTLEFMVNNESSGLTGLVVANLRGTAEVPIPGSMWLLASSLIILLGFKRRFRN